MRGFTKVEILILVGIIAVLAALVVVLIPRGQFETSCSECVSNVRTLAGLLESVQAPERDANLLVYLTEKAELEREPDLLYCPGDARPRSEHRTSYAFRRLNDPECPVKPGVALIADDSDDHHDGKGFVVGYTDGTVKWRDKVDDWQLPRDTHVKVGEDSVVEELRCLRSE